MTTATPSAASSFSSNPSVHVLACATEHRQESAVLWRSAEVNGFRFHPVGVGEPWQGFATKFMTYLRTLHGLVGRTVRADDIVILMDAWDTVILGDVDELLKKISWLPADGILCGAERVCGPNHFLVGQMEALYPEVQTPWRYPNSGGLVATADAMVDLLHGLIHDTQEGAALNESDNDQVRLHEYLIFRAERGDPVPLHLDTDCSVFQCMYEEQPQWDIDVRSSKSPRIVNQLTSERPLVAHGNGHTGRWFLSALYAELNLLDHLGLTMDELRHLPHEMPVPPGTIVTDEIKSKYCPWWYTPGLHKGASDGFSVFYMIRDLQRREAAAHRQGE